VAAPQTPMQRSRLRLEIHSGNAAPLQTGNSGAGGRSAA
jgi:hypothetical protein